MSEAAPRPAHAARKVEAAVDPGEGHARAGGGRAVHGHVVAHVHRPRRLDAEGVEGRVQDAWVGLGEAAPLGGHNRVEERPQSRGGQAGVLHAVDPVRDHPQREAAAEGHEHPAAPGQAVAPRGEMGHEVAGETPGPVFPRGEGREQLAEAFHLERGLRDLASPISGPQRIVDRAIRGEDARRERQAQPAQGPAQGGPLGAVEVEERAVEVEENGPDP